MYKNEAMLARKGLLAYFPILQSGRSLHDETVCHCMVQAPRCSRDKCQYVATRWEQPQSRSLHHSHLNEIHTTYSRGKCGVPGVSKKECVLHDDQMAGNHLDLGSGQKKGKADADEKCE